MIEGRWNGAAFTRLLTAAVRSKVAERSGRHRANRWRRADLLWPDFAPRYKD
ncbi:hypothetical protein [Croceicoccus bisphenolivorans]|uniref:hypothetical protein n=1 Tax=Croceicoccus bisphenolivorans TaxID=1783232 RepID=UPI000AFCD5BE|nr:hypothetical protein [Croceicoccus bisphenolivorans]